MPRSALFVGLLLACGHVVAACSAQGCGATTLPAGLPTTPRAQARAVVKVLVVGVDEADKTCAEIADRKDDATISDRCATARARAKAALLIAANGVDAYDEGRRGDVACATALGAESARVMVNVIESEAGRPPPALVDALDLFSQFMKGQCDAVDAGNGDAS